MNLSNEQEIDNFIECCRKMAEHGATYFMIAADDSTPRGVDGYKLYSTEEQQKFASAGEAHGYLMKRIYDALKPEFPDIHLAMVAAPYSLDHGIGTPSVDKYVTDWAKPLRTRSRGSGPDGPRARENLMWQKNRK